MRQHKFCPDKQQYNMLSFFLPMLLHLKRQKTIMNVSNVVHEPGIYIS